MGDFAHRQQAILMGLRSKDGFVHTEDAPFAIRPTTSWHGNEVRDLGGVTITFQVEGKKDEPPWQYEFWLSIGMLKACLDMQTAAQEETDKWIREAREKATDGRP